jgi:hypothetical protein
LVPKNRGKSKTRLAINSNLGFEQDKLERLLDATEGIELDLYTPVMKALVNTQYIYVMAWIGING